MKQEIIAKRYANALVQIAKEKNLIDTYEQEMAILRTVVTENRQFTTFLHNPNIPIDEKKNLVKQGFSTFSQDVLHMIYLLIDRGHEDVFAEVAEMYVEYANKVRNIADATVTSVRLLTEEERRVVAATFARICQKREIRIHNVVDDNILGGMKVKIGNRIYDGSLQGKVARLSRQLIANRM